ncbi:MAG: hypothetical protein V4525_09160 [Pseudomonadota bacterium]
MKNILDNYQTKYHKKIFFLACIFISFPIWLATYPPLVDLPGHLFQTSFFLKLFFNKNHYLHSLYTINWFTPYWTSYGVIALFSMIMPLEIATKLFISIAVSSTAWAASQLRELAHNDTSWDWLFLTIGYGFSFQWGFLNFMISVPLVLLFIRYVILYLHKPTLGKGLLIFFWAIILFFSHILSLFFAFLILSVYEFSLNRSTKDYIKKFLPILLSFIPIIIWLKIFIINDYSSNKLNFEWFVGLHTFTFITDIFGAAFPNTYIFIMCTLYSIMIVSSRSYNFRYLSNNLHKKLPLIITLLMVLGPSTVFNIFLVSQRFTIFLLVFYVFSLDIKNLSKQNNKKAFLFIILSLSILFQISKKIISFEKDYRSFQNVITHTQPHKRLSLLSIYSSSDSEFNAPIFLNFSLYYKLEKEGINDCSFSSSQLIVQCKKNMYFFYIEPNLSQKKYQTTILKKHDNFYDYLILRGDTTDINLKKKTAENFGNLIYANKIWWVYQRK